MPEAAFLILHVDDPLASAAFYARLLDVPIVESSPTFAMLPLREGMMLGLWSRHTVEPAPAAFAGAMEIGFAVGSPDEVDARHAAWRAAGLPILQAPREMDFGRTFVALDPDK